MILLGGVRALPPLELGLLGVVLEELPTDPLLLNEEDWSSSSIFGGMVGLAPLF